MEKLTLGGLDEVVAIGRTWISAVGDDRSVSLLGPSGEALQGLLHSEWTVLQARKLLGRTADLRDAYKQLAPRPAHQVFDAGH